MAKQIVNEWQCVKHWGPIVFIKGTLRTHIGFCLDPAAGKLLVGLSFGGPQPPGAWAFGWFVGSHKSLMIADGVVLEEERAEDGSPTAVSFPHDTPYARRWIKKHGLSKYGLCQT